MIARRSLASLSALRAILARRENRLQRHLQGQGAVFPHAVVQSIVRTYPGHASAVPVPRAPASPVQLQEARRLARAWLAELEDWQIAGLAVPAELLDQARRRVERLGYV